VRKNSDFHLLEEAYRQVLREAVSPPVGPGVCYFETEKLSKRSGDVSAKTSTGKWRFIRKGGKRIGIMSVDETGKPSGHITTLRIIHSQLTVFDGSGLSELKTLDLHHNQLTAFDGTGMSSLDYLGLNHNQLTSFKGSNLSKLADLFLVSNKLTSFSGAGLTSLEYLDISFNQLTSFDGKGLRTLSDLLISNNQLTSLDVSKSKMLMNLRMYHNPFHNLNGPAVRLPKNANEYWIDGKSLGFDEDKYEIAREKYLRPIRAKQVMTDAGLPEDLFDV
jgi:hypothetical protein